MVQQAVQHRRGDHAVAQQFAPLAEALVGSEDDAATFVAGKPGWARKTPFSAPVYPRRYGVNLPSMLKILGGVGIPPQVQGERSGVLDVETAYWYTPVGGDFATLLVRVAETTSGSVKVLACPSRPRRRVGRLLRRRFPYRFRRSSRAAGWLRQIGGGYRRRRFRTGDG